MSHKQVPVYEIVGLLYYEECFDMAERINEYGIAPPDGYALVPIAMLNHWRYTAPPPSQDVQALIAEIDGVERFDVVPCDSFNFGMNPSDIGDWFDVDDIRAILDKYRSAK